MTYEISRTKDPRTDFAENRFKRGTGDFGSIATFDSEGDSNISVLVDRVETLVNETGSLQYTVHSRPLHWTGQILDLGEPDYILTKSIPIVVEEYPADEMFVARFAELELFGTGVTEISAIQELKHEILDLYNELTDLPVEELGILPLSWCRVLNLLIEKK